MRRFLVDEELKEGALVTLSAEESKHALKSLRLGPGSQIALVNGRGLEAEGIIQTADLSGARVEIRSVKQAEKRIPVEILQGVLKGPKMDWLVEKLTEIGITSLHLATTRYTVASGEKIDRWQRIALSAIKQSGNPQIPSLFPPRPITELAREFDDALKILLQPGAKMGLADLVKANLGRRIVLAIGPEGGFAPEEEKLLAEAGFEPAALSRQILRGETAALVAASLAIHAIDF